MSEYYILRFTSSAAPVGPFATRDEATEAQMERSISGTVFERRPGETLDDAEVRAMETTLNFLHIDTGLLRPPIDSLW